MSFQVGDKVRVLDEHDIPAIFRGGKPTVGVVNEVSEDVVLVNVPIGDDDPEYHSQCVPYQPHMLVTEEDPDAED